jgi:hypothetical protein
MEETVTELPLLLPLIPEIVDLLLTKVADLMKAVEKVVDLLPKVADLPKVVENLLVEWQTKRQIEFHPQQNELLKVLDPV